MSSNPAAPDEAESLVDDAIVAEVRRTRERLAAEADHDFDRQWNHWESLEAEQRARGRSVITRPLPGSSRPGAAA